MLPAPQVSRVTRDQRNQQVREAQIRLLYSHSGIGFSVTILATLIMAYLQWRVISHPVLLGWSVYMFLVACARFLLSQLFHGGSAPVKDMRIWNVYFCVGVGFAAFGWASTAFLLYSESELANQVSLCFVLGGMILGAGSLLAARPEGFVLFIVPVSLATALRLLSQRDDAHVAMSLLVALFGLTTLRTTWVIHRTVTSAFFLQFENNDLVADLRTAQRVSDTVNQELEARVHERTAELNQAVLHMQEEIAERKRAEEERSQMEITLRHAQKLEAIGLLAGGIAHDFNNILTSIAGYTTLVHDRIPADSEYRGHLDQVLKASARAGDLVRRLLMFSRRGERAGSLVAFEPVVMEAFELLKATIPASIDFRIRIEPGCGSIFADSSLIHQIVLNLCTNSYQAMAGGVGRLDVTLSPVEVTPVAPIKGLANGLYTRLTVADNSSGIPPEIAHRVFEPFFTTKPTGQGTGLGLSVVHGIVTRYGGSIQFENNPSGGVTFLVHLPRVATDQSVQPESPAPLPGGSERILFVDDDEAIAQLGRDMLQRIGYTVTVKTGSMEALAAFSKDPRGFDLVVTDFTMPKMTGGELIRQIKNLRSDIPVILTSGFNDEVMTPQEASLLGVGEYLKKPFSKSALARAVRSVLT